MWCTPRNSKEAFVWGLVGFAQLGSQQSPRPFLSFLEEQEAASRTIGGSRRSDPISAGQAPALPSLQASGQR